MKLSFFKYLFVIIICNASITLWSNVIPADRVVAIDQLQTFLKPEIREQLKAKKGITNERLAAYFKEAFSDRFFYDHQTFPERFSLYNEIYDNPDHEKRALDHIGKYNGNAKWKLPFNYLNGKPVNAYALRHLARQHKMVDIAFLYFNDGKNPKYIDYFTEQMQSLNDALLADQYETIKDGNGVYEVFRSGYRIMNWLWIHNMFLNEPSYTADDQLLTIATLLQHAAHLNQRNGEFKFGNHQTKGMASLAMLGILFSDFEGSDQWLNTAMSRLEEHLDKEINADGFQFERSMHYHMSDIRNYFYVYQLANINHLSIDENWTNKMKELFTTLVKVAYPDKGAPVLQDDTGIAWAEKNNISPSLTLGYLLFEDEEFGYFAGDKVPQSVYWFLKKDQLDLLKNIEKKKPTYGSLAFPFTHYYIMREGWSPKDKMMIISAGVDPDKPDHQHGDILGIQAVANGQVILPNYQVRYPLPDFQYFKNSMVKNVALVDDQLLGKQWTSNKGGSGFGKFLNLPQPTVINWTSNDDIDFFVGSHDGFEDIGVKYSRQVIYVKNNFWIVKDNFKSDKTHDYKQVWQGHYTSEEGPNLLRAIFDDGSGCDILQLNPVDRVTQAGTRGKQSNLLSKQGTSVFNFITVIFPYGRYNERIDELATKKSVKDWIVNQSNWATNNEQAVSLSKKKEDYFFQVNQLNLDQLEIECSDLSDLHLQLDKNQLTIMLIGDAERNIKVVQDNIELTDTILKPGDQIVVALK